jgi:hypothetical protein
MTVTSRVLALLLVFALCFTFSYADVKPVQFTLSIAYAGLAVADTALTIYGTSRLGLIETNKLMAPLLEHGRYAAVWAIGAAQVLAITAICHWLISSDEKMPKILGYSILAASVIFRGCVVIQNIRLHSRVR